MNLKNPDESKKGLERCSERAMHCGPEDPKCSYDCGSEECILNLMHDALAYIQQLEADNAQLNRCIENMTDKLNAAHDETAQMKAERDAAVADIRFAFTSYVGACQTCKHGENQVDCIEPIRCPDCENEKCKCQSCDGDFRNWEWRGVQKEE